MSCLSWKNIAYALILVFATPEILRATTGPLEETHRPLPASTIFCPDVDREIFLSVGNGDHDAMSLACRNWQGATSFYYQGIADHILNGLPVTFAFSKKLLRRTLEDRISTQGFLVIPKSCHLYDCLPRKRSPLNTQDLRMNFETSARLYGILFKENLLIDTPNTLLRLQHLLASLPYVAIFLHEDQREFAGANFFKIYTPLIENEFEQMANVVSYLSLTSDLLPKENNTSQKSFSFCSDASGSCSLEEQKACLIEQCNIKLFSDDFFSYADKDNRLKKPSQVLVMTDAQLNNTENIQMYSFFAHYNNKIILDIGASPFVTQGVLTLALRTIPYKIDHLILTNIAGNITSIGDDFSTKFDLKSLDIQKLSALTSVGENFLERFSSVAFFDNHPLSSSFTTNSVAQKNLSLNSDSHDSVPSEKKYDIKEILAARGITYIKSTQKKYPRDPNSFSFSFPDDDGQSFFLSSQK